MRSQEFTFSIDGKDVSPSTVAARDLFDLILSLEAAIAATAQGLGATDADDLQFSLVRISDGSDAAGLALSEQMFRGAEVVSRSIKQNDFTALPPEAHGHLRRLWKRSRATNWSLSIIPKDNGIVRCVIDPRVEILRPTPIAGRTTLYGTLDRIGGERKPTAVLIVPHLGRLTIRIATRAFAQELADSLFEAIGLEGEATWNSESWEIEDFHADRIVPDFQQVTPSEAFAHLATAAGDRWDEIDPDEYVRELRSED